MTALVEWIVAALLIGGGIFGLIGSFGLLKLRDPMQRLHAPTKAATMGLAGVLLASAIFFLGVRGELSWQEFLITIFIFLTAPLTAFFLSKLNLTRMVRRDSLPPTGTGRDWASFEPDAPPVRARPDADARPD